MPVGQLPAGFQAGMRVPHQQQLPFSVESWLRHELQDQFLNVNKKLDILLEQVSIYSVHGHGPSGTLEALQLWSRIEGGEGVPPAMADGESTTGLRPQELVRRHKAPPLRIPAASAFSATEPPATEESESPPGSMSPLGRHRDSDSSPIPDSARPSKNMATKTSVTWDEDSIFADLGERVDSFTLGESANQQGAPPRHSADTHSSAGLRLQAKSRQSTSSPGAGRRPSLLTSMFGDHGPKGRPAITSVLSYSSKFSHEGPRRCYQYEVWEFLEEPESSTAAVWYHKMMFALIIISCVWNFLQTIEPPPLSGDFPMALEVVFDAIFLVELALRFFATKNKARFFCLIHNTIDFIGAFPPLVLRIISSYFMYDEALRGNMRTALLCLVPVFRLLKMLRRWEKFNLLIFSGADLVLEIMPVLMVMMFLMALTFSSLIYFVEPQSNIPDLSKALWLTIVTMTTVGYGDTVPKTTPGMYITLVLVISSALYMAVPLGIVGNAFSQVWEDRDWLFLVQQVRDRLDQNNYKAEDIPRLFKMFGGKNGELTLSDFYRMIMEMRLGIKEDRVLKLFMSFDTDSSGTIDSIEFVRAIFPGSYADLYGRRCEELSSLGSCEDLTSLPGSAHSVQSGSRHWAPDWSSTSSRARRSYVEEMNRRMHSSETTLRIHGSGSSSNPLRHLALIEEKAVLKSRHSRRGPPPQPTGDRYSGTPSNDRFSALSGSLQVGNMSVTTVDSNTTLNSIQEAQIINTQHNYQQ